MHVGRINNATRVLGAPKDWNRDANGPCGNLPIRDEATTAGPGMTSAWFPTPEEIERIKDGAPIYLTVLGSVHPPVDVSVGPRPGFNG
jgi:hypothetical protein